MSRTDVHTPYWVKARQPEWRRYFAENHNHERGTCDLAEYLAAKEWTRTNCTIGLAWSDRNICCGCKLCTGQPGRRLARRQERAQWRAVRQQMLALVDHEEFDIPVIRGRAW